MDVQAEGAGRLVKSECTRVENWTRSTFEDSLIWDYITSFLGKDRGE